jgi:hypothetical protein
MGMRQPMLGLQSDPLPHPTIRPSAMDSGPSGPRPSSTNLPFTSLPIYQFTTYQSPNFPISHPYAKNAESCVYIDRNIVRDSFLWLLRVE